MRCVSPMSVPRPPGRCATDRIIIPCGQCFACIANLRESWCNRIMAEQKHSSSSNFITLTYATEHLKFTSAGLPTLCKKDFQNFAKRLRKKLASMPEFKTVKLKYYAIGEYGTKKLRPHYHIALFNFPQLGHIAKLIDFISDSWGLGSVHVGKIELASVRYVTNYVINKYVHDEFDEREKPFSLISKGMGLSYLTPEIIGYHQNNEEFTMRTIQGKALLPRYYKEKLFHKDQIKLNRERTQPEIDKRYEENQKRRSEFSSGNPFFYRMQAETQARIQYFKKLKGGSTF
ncbi:MAG: replication initiator protein [Microviridae sp.]|nr:MAG: replication initiator protein [Microviridae sp.]